MEGTALAAHLRNYTYHYAASAGLHPELERPGLLQPRPSKKHNRSLSMHNVFVQNIAENDFSVFEAFRAKIKLPSIFKANMTWFGACISISRYFLLSEYDMPSGPGANKHDFLKRIRLGCNVEIQ